MNTIQVAIGAAPGEDLLGAKAATGGSECGDMGEGRRDSDGPRNFGGQSQRNRDSDFEGAIAIDVEENNRDRKSVV